MQRILFVCLGNICRSPLAEFIFSDLAEKAGMGDRFVVASAGTSAEEQGNPVYPPVAALLREQGIDCSAKRARQMTAADYDGFDLIVGMEEKNLSDVRRITGGDVQNKLSLLLSYTTTPADIADPWYTRDFALTYEQVVAGCTALLARLR